MKSVLDVVKAPYRAVNWRLYRTIRELTAQLQDQRQENQRLQEMLATGAGGAEAADEPPAPDQDTLKAEEAERLERFLAAPYRTKGTPLDRSPPDEERRNEIVARLEAMKPWFSYFDFGAGITTPPKPEEAAKTTGMDYFELRASRVFDALEKHLNPAETSFLDVGCSDGYFPIEAARRGYADVLGLDVRAESVARARYAAELYGLDNVRFELDSVYELNHVGGKKYDVVLCHGVFYHLSDPVRAMERLFAATGKVGLVGGWTANGGDESFALSWEDADRYLNGDRPILVIPTAKALARLMALVGYADVREVLRPGIAAEADWREYIGFVE